MDDVAKKCVTDLTTRIKSIKEFSTANKISHIYADEDVMAITKGLSFPAIGIIYEGMRPLPSGRPDNQGLQQEATCSVILFFRAAPSMSTNDAVLEALTLTDTIRNTLLGTVSPTGHRWKFVMEASMGGSKGLLGFVQRWSTATPLVPK